jgi:hypothetical protein
LYAGQSIHGSRSTYHLDMQTDGNLVLYSTPGTSNYVWATWTQGHPGAFAVLQGTDGNLVVYPPGGGAGLWASSTGGYTIHDLIVQNDGNLVMYLPDGMPAWDRHGAGLIPWRKSARAAAIMKCESGGDYGMVDGHTGTNYYGAWQADRDFWTTWGGTVSYLSTRPFAAPHLMQDEVAYRGWLSRGWQPWECNSLV